MALTYTTAHITIELSVLRLRPDSSRPVLLLLLISVTIDPCYHRYLFALGFFWHLVSSGIGYLLALDIFWHWISYGIGYLLGSGTF